jgi:hypothetical protein
MAEIDASAKGIKGVIIEAAGDVKQDGIIRTTEDAFVGIRTLGKYESNGGQIIQGDQRQARWWENTPVQLLIILGALAGIGGLYWVLK